jgi:ClpP class serine protease
MTVSKPLNLPKPRIIKRMVNNEIYQKALELNLVDELKTSDDFLLAAASEQAIYQLNYQQKKGFLEKLTTTMHKSVGYLGWQEKLDNVDERVRLQ